MFMKLLEKELKRCLNIPSHTGDREARHMLVHSKSAVAQAVPPVPAGWTDIQTLY